MFVNILAATAEFKTNMTKPDTDKLAYCLSHSVTLNCSEECLTIWSEHQKSKNYIHEIVGSVIIAEDGNKSWDCNYNFKKKKTCGLWSFNKWCLKSQSHCMSGKMAIQ